MRRLQHDQVGVLEEPAHADLQEGTRGDVVAVKDGDVFGTRDFERRVDVARLGVVVVVADQVAHAQLFAELTELGTAAVVEHIHVQAIGGPVQAHGREHRLAHHFKRLVVGRNEHIHARPGADVLGHGNRAALQGPRRLEVANEQHRKGIQLCQHQAIAECRIQPVGKADGVGKTPVDVTRRGRDRQHDHCQRGQAAGGPAQQQGRTKRTHRKENLPLEIQRYADDQPHQQGTEHHSRDTRYGVLPQIPPGDGMHHGAPVCLGTVGIGVSYLVGLRALVDTHCAAPASGSRRRCAKTRAHLRRSSAAWPWGSYSSTLWS
ncbi:hypothetical protein D3C71_1193430 [compost metagenome]